MRTRRRQNGRQNGGKRHDDRRNVGNNSANNGTKSDKRQLQTITGVISTTSKGAGYIDNADPKRESTYIEPGFLNTALNGDSVEVLIHKDGSAKVLKVLKRARDTFVGRITVENGSFILVPDDRKMYVGIIIQKGRAADGKIETSSPETLKENQKVLARMLPWTDPEVRPRGQIVKILGFKGENEVEMESIVLESGFETKFPPAVEKDAERIGAEGKKIAPEEISKRRDMRGVTTFTIDPFDAKDFDDAVSFRKISEAETLRISKANVSGPFYEVGVHIADVSHYVREGTALDREALKRGCSVYLVDRTIPMLPEALSNDICSLNPHEDKLTFSAVFILDDKARVISRWFGRTVINSDHRFSYETAQAAIDGKAANVEKYSNGIQKAALAEAGLKYRDDLVILNHLAKILMRDKFSKGAIEFEQEEIRFRLDTTGRPLGVYKKERLDTHKLVEEYMLLANREVAGFISDSIKKRGMKDLGSIYRVHDAPDKERMKTLAFFVKALGYDLRTKDGTVTAGAINDLLDQIEDTPHESLIRTATIRSMQKAVYSTKNIGHFGLAFKFYTHFTSPIRRYPDLLVHRILARHLSGGSFSGGDVSDFQRIAESSTSREIDASEAERTSVKLKQVEYMSAKIGNVFQGVISGVTKWGIYVEDKETKSEGMIHIGELGKDYFVFDEKTYSIVGEKTKIRFTLGDEVTFKVVAADLDRRTLSYGLVTQ